MWSHGGVRQADAQGRRSAVEAGGPQSETAHSALQGVREASGVGKEGPALRLEDNEELFQQGGGGMEEGASREPPREEGKNRAGRDVSYTPPARGARAPGTHADVTSRQEKLQCPV